MCGLTDFFLDHCIVSLLTKAKFRTKMYDASLWKSLWKFLYLLYKVAQRSKSRTHTLYYNCGFICVDSWVEISVKQILFLQYCSFGQTENIFICEMSDKRNDVTIIIIWSLQGCDARKIRHSHTSDSAAVLCCPQWVTLVTKPEVHNMRSTTPQPGNMCRKFVKFGQSVYRLSEHPQPVFVNIQK